MDTLEERVERLERSCRRWRLGFLMSVGGGGGRDGGGAEPAGGWAVCSFDGSKPYHSKPAGWGVYFCQLRKGCFFDQAGIAGGGDGGCAFCAEGFGQCVRFAEYGKRPEQFRARGR